MESSHGILNFSLILSIGCSLFFLAQFFEDIRIGLIFSLSILIMGPWYIWLSCWTLNPTWKWSITPVLWFAEFDYCLFILWIYYKKIAICFRSSIRFGFLLIFLMICIVFKTGPDREVRPWKPKTGMKTSFLNIKNRIFC